VPPGPGAPDPAEGAYSAPANPIVGGEGLAVPSPRTPSSALGPLGLASATPTPNLDATPMKIFTITSCVNDTLSISCYTATRRRKTPIRYTTQ